jgi:hypothetical protein
MITTDDDIIQALATKHLESKYDLKNWLLYFIDVDLADCTVSHFSTSNPLDMVWEIYSFCKENNSVDPMTVYYIAGRSSQKTLSAAVLQILLPLHFKRGLVHLGGTKQQARRAYDYFRKFISKKYIRPFLKGDPTMDKTVFSVGGEDVEVEILPISPMSVQGPHQPVVSLDELGSLSPDKIKAYEDVSGIPSYTKDGEPWIQFGISSRHGKYTVIEKEYDNREKSGVLFRFWTVFENTKHCPDSISGTQPLDMYIDPIQNIAVLKEDFEKMSPEHASKLLKVEAREKCITCPLAAQCGGALKRQTSKCRSLRPVQSVITQFKKAPSLEWWLSQSMSLTPSSEGLVFPRFKREVFEKTVGEIYEIFTGEKCPEGYNEDDLIKFMIEKGVKRYAGIDHGYTHPMAIVVAYEDSRDNVYIMASEERAGLEPPQALAFFTEMWHKYQFTVAYPDTEAPNMNAMLRTAKLCSIMDNFTKSIEGGITAIRGKLSPTVGTTRLFGLEGKVDTLTNNFENYHFKLNSAGDVTDDVDDVDDDSVSALRYVGQNKWLKRGGLNLSKNPEVATPESLKAEQERIKAAYPAEIRKQQTNWLQKEIGTAIKESGGEPSLKTSKNKSIFWDI